MSESNGLPRVVTKDTRAELREARRNNKLLREKIHGRQLERANQLLEAYSNYDWVAAYSDMLDRFRGADIPAFSVSTPWDRRFGKDFPIFQTEQDLMLLRMPARILLATNNYAIGLAEGITSYVIADGYKYRAVGDDPDLARAVQGVIDDFLERNNWHGGEDGSLEEELFWRSLEDGEYFLIDFTDAQGFTTVRTAEPEQVTQAGSGWSWEEGSFGILADPDDPQTKHAYWVFYGDGGESGEEYAADRVVHVKRNVKRSIKRGIPDFSFETLDSLTTAAKLRRAMTLGAAIQASIVGVRQWETATQSDVNSMQDLLTDYTRTNPVTGNQENFKKYNPGEWQDIPKGMQYVPPPAAANASQHVEILQSALRAASRRWNAPDWLASGDMGDTNYASSLTAENPFVRTVQRRQGTYRHAFLTSVKRAVERYIRFRGGLRVRKKRDDGRVTEEFFTAAQVFRMIDIQCEPPSIIVRDKTQEAQQNQIYYGMRVKPPQVICEELGLDPEKVTADFEAWEQRTGVNTINLPLPGDEKPGAGEEGLPKPE